MKADLHARLEDLINDYDRLEILKAFIKLAYGETNSAAYNAAANVLTKEEK